MMTMHSRSENEPITSLRGALVVLVLVAPLACRTSSSTPPADTATPGPDAIADTPTGEAEEETPERACKGMLARFSPDVIAGEQADCVAALTTHVQLEACDDVRRVPEYLACFEQCLASIALDPAIYDAGDASTKPVDNCEVGCYSTTCE